MALYRDEAGQLYWHERVAAGLEPPTPSPTLAAHGLYPTIARIKSARASWIDRGLTGLIAVSFILCALSIWATSLSPGTGLGLAVTGFLLCGWARHFFIDLLCAERVRHEQHLFLCATQPAAPAMLPIAMVVTLIGPFHALFWGRWLDVGADQKTALLPAFVLGWMLWRRVKQWRTRHIALRNALAARAS